MGLRLNQLETLNAINLNEDILRAFGESSLAVARPWKPTNTVRGSACFPKSKWFRIRYDPRSLRT